jgi:nitrogen fixation protein
VGVSCKTSLILQQIISRTERLFQTWFSSFLTPKTGTNHSLHRTPRSHDSLLKGKIDIEEGKIINVGQITEYYFGDLVNGKVPEGAEIRKNRFGGKIAKLKEKTKFGGKFLKLNLIQWRERTKHVFSDTMLPHKTENSTTDPVKDFVDKMESIIQHDKDGTLKERTLKGKIEIEGKINNIEARTEYYFGDLVNGMVPEGAEGENIGKKIAKLKEFTKFGGKYLNLNLQQWRGRTKHVFADTMLPETTEERKTDAEKVKDFVNMMKNIIEHHKDGTLNERTLKGKIDIEEGKIINVGQITEYYFGEVNGEVPEGKGEKIGYTIDNVKRTKSGGKYLNLNLQQWRERTKHVFADTMLPETTRDRR